jgi:hypothetical protein
MTGPDTGSFEGVTVMGLRGRFLSVAGGWFALLAAVLITVPLVLRDRLPEPMASHWGEGGAPDGSMSFVALLALQVGMWVLIGGGACAVALWAPGALGRRVSRMGIGALLGGGGPFLVGLQLLTLTVNLDVPTWSQVGQMGWGVPLAAIVVMLLGGGLGALAARPGPDELPRSSGTATETIRLRPGQRAVWVSSVRNGWLTGIGGSLLTAGVGFTVAALISGNDGLWPHAGIMTVAGLLILTFSSLRTQITEDGLRISYGPLRLLRRHIPINRVQRAWSEERFPSNAGGWGIRGVPGAATVMIRGGECLVVGYVSGGRFTISIDDAERGAALLNTLVARTPAGSGLG